MSFLFRELVENDIKKIIELSNSMDLRNDPKIGDIAPSLFKASKCYLFGAFLDGKLVGVGGLRDKAKDLAWIEDIRVHGKYQKMGVGTALFKHGEELAHQRGFSKVGFQTVTENKGTCRIGEKLGFQRKHEMFALYLPEIPKLEYKNKEIAKLEIDEAINMLKKIPEGPEEEICIGWSYAPIKKEFFESEPDMNFYILRDTILFEYLERDSKSEISFIKAIVYGSPDNVRDLLFDYIKRNMKWKKRLFYLCPEKLTSKGEELGFKYGNVWTGGKNIVVLFTKKFP